MRSILLYFAKFLIKLQLTEKILLARKQILQVADLKILQKRVEMVFGELELIEQMRIFLAQVPTCQMRLSFIFGRAKTATRKFEPMLTRAAGEAPTVLKRCQNASKISPGLTRTCQATRSPRQRRNCNVKISRVPSTLEIFFDE